MFKPVAVFAVLIEYESPDGEQIDDALSAMLEAVRHTTPIPPVSVTAFAGEAALAVLAAGEVDHGSTP